MKITPVVLTLLLISAPFVTVSASARNAFDYREKTGDKCIKFTWKIVRVNGFKMLISYKAGFTDTYLVGKDGSIYQWERSNPAEKTDFTAKRNGQEITVTGSLKGKTVNKTVAAKGAFWFQHIAYCLSGFSQSRRNEISFFVLRPEDMKSFGMNATRAEVEMLKQRGEKTAAQKIRVTLAGFLSRFWHGFYWYDREAGHFLRYEGVNGPPGSPRTVITLE